MVHARSLLRRKETICLQTIKLNVLNGVARGMGRLQKRADTLARRFPVFARKLKATAYG
jgi:hypothetical protein